ncbi:MAG: hypothetical protein IJH09_03815 [Clostridia bacterium]|nr:hypothetical protein [Clostridia bacterium]
MGKHYGTCALCKKETELTFEHIPPKSAFNATPAKAVTLMGMLQNKERLPWEAKGVHYLNLQQGMGYYSLCSSCNSLTGEWYGDEYKRFAGRAAYLVSSNIPDGMHSVEFKNIYPLRIIKQILSMFCSINRPGLFPIDDLRAFVLDKEATSIDKKKYRIQMYFTKSGFVKCAPLFSISHINPDESLSTTVVSEITFAPLGFLLYLDPEEGQSFEGIDITAFTDVKYDQNADVTFPIEFREVNTWLPIDYRTRPEIMETIEKNKKWKEENGHN